MWRLIPHGISLHTRPPSRTLRGGWGLNQAPEPGSGREETPGSAAASRAVRLRLAANAPAPRTRKHRAKRLSVNTQAQEGLFVSSQALPSPGSFASCRCMKKLLQRGVGYLSPRQGSRFIASAGRGGPHGWLIVYSFFIHTQSGCAKGAYQPRLSQAQCE